MKESFKEKIMPVAMAAGFYGALYAGLEAQHNYQCPREDLHSNFSESHMSKEMIAEREARAKQHAELMKDSADSSIETAEIFADINRINHDIIHKLGVIEGIFIAREQAGLNIITGEPK